MKRIVVLAALALLLLSPTFASAAIEYAGPPSGQTYYYPGGGTVGTEFYSNVSARVTSLGVFDYGSDGLSGDHEVDLWDVTTGTPILVASVTIPYNDPYLHNGYRWEPPTVGGSVVAGHEYVIGAGYYGDGENDWFQPYADIDPHFTMVQDRYHDDGGSPISFPESTMVDSASWGWFGPNLKVATPEPATMIVWSLLGAASWLGMRVTRRGRRVGRQWSDENRTAILGIIEQGRG